MAEDRGSATAMYAEFVDAYVRTLPARGSETLRRLPMTWADGAEVAALGESTSGVVVAQYRRMAREQWEACKKHLPKGTEMEDFTAALAYVEAGAHGSDEDQAAPPPIRAPDGRVLKREAPVRGAYLIPGMDLLHGGLGTQCNVEVRSNPVDAGKQGLAEMQMIEALKPIKKGEVLLLNFGELPTPMCFVKYGFYPNAAFTPRYPVDTVPIFPGPSMPPESGPGADGLAKLRWQCIHAQGYEKHHLRPYEEQKCAGRYESPFTVSGHEVAQAEAGRGATPGGALQRLRQFVLLLLDGREVLERVRDEGRMRTAMPVERVRALFDEIVEASMARLPSAISSKDRDEDEVLRKCRRLVLKERNMYLRLMGDDGAFAKALDAAAPARPSMPRMPLPEGMDPSQCPVQ